MSGWGAGNWAQGWVLCCRQDPSDSSGLGLVCLFSGAVALCIHFAGLMEGSPGGANPGRGPGRQVAGLWTGSDRGDQAWDLCQPEEGEMPRGSEVPFVQRPGPLHSLSRVRPRAASKDSKRGCLRPLPAPQPFPDRRTRAVWPVSGSDPTEVSCPQGGSIFPPNTYSRSSSSSMAGSCIRSPLSGKAPRE